METITVIIPVYNGEKTIERCIRSVISQSYKEIEIIVVDDGSSDNTLSVCKKIRDKDGRLRIFHKDNGGVSLARNYGIQRASGKYLFFLDSDDELDRTVLEGLIKKEKETILVGCRIGVVEGKRTRMIARRKVYPKDLFMNYLATGKIEGFSCGYLFEKSICSKVLFDKSVSYCEDLVFIISYLQNSGIKNICYIDENNGFLHYNQHGDNATISRSRIYKNLDSVLKVNDIIGGNVFSNRAVGLFEAEMQKASTRADFAHIIDTFVLPNYCGKNIRLKVFSFLYRHRLLALLRCYYLLRKMTKTVIMGVKK